MSIGKAGSGRTVRAGFIVTLIWSICRMSPRPTRSPTIWKSSPPSGREDWGCPQVSGCTNLKTNWWLATLEGRYNLLPDLQLTAFYDHGSIRRDHNSAYTGAQTPASGALKGLGVGVSWSKPGVFSLRGTIANRLGSNPFRTTTVGPSFGKDSDGSYDKTRMWLTGTLFF